MRPLHRPFLSALALACACTPRETDTLGFGTPTITTAPSATTEGSSTSSGGSSTRGVESTSTSAASSSSSSSGPLLDMPMPDFGPQHPIGCQGKIDFLFSINASGTMQHHQDQLIAAFPDFIEAIETQFPNFDVHILVAEDGYWGIDDCSLCTTSCDPQGTPPLCSAMLDACDTKTIGAGVTFPAGKEATNRRCELAGGRRYITRDEAEIGKAFACIAQVGIGGGERTAEAVVQALTPELNGAGGCNEGFLRDDALLVVTIINDGYDEASAGTVDSWIAALRAAKHEDDDAFAVLVLTTDVDVDYGQLCLPDQFNPNKNPLRSLVENVDHGKIGSICEKQYGEFFSSTISELVALCDGLVIPQ
ncbi:hypothetical protein [Nannocystis pusilla]|uniref:VWFA domain-containing protein n=1 Tax=Nannocystis pusilla TaxID=889268 RepID=A0ABS7TN35_9BACT|nr:hypothetical protein [Nannocystis pusilla]MBZ5709634.1 hypothetical protein [Nannocystis pusilla]